METYKGTINEFVDWVTGNDSSTNRNITGGLPVSGASIRELLQDRLKEPIYVYEDEVNGLFRLFSSKTAADKWIVGHDPTNPGYDPEGTDHFEIINFEKPSEFVLSQTGIPVDTRYVVKGSGNTAGATIQYYVNIKDSNNQTKSDSLIITYTITNTATGTVKTISEDRDSSYVNNPSKPLTKDLYEYLTDGTNEINVNIRGRSVSNSIDIPFAIVLVSFEISSAFDYNKGVSGTNFRVPVTASRSVTSGFTLTLKVCIDGIDTSAKLTTGGDAVFTTLNTGSRITNEFNLSNIYSASTTDNPHLYHTMYISGTMINLSGNTFNSNVLIYTFEVSSDDDVINHFINISESIPANKVESDENGIRLAATQYEAFTLNWGYYTDLILKDLSINVDWALRSGTEEAGYTYENITTIVGINRRESDPLRFIPAVYTTDANTYLIATYNGETLASFAIDIAPTSLSNIYETTGEDLKLTAYGKSNNSPTKDIWADETHNVTTTFTGVTFDSQSGWDDNSFMTSGLNSYATINYCPFPNNFSLTGRTIEIEFKSEQVDNAEDVLVKIGGDSGGNIIISPDTATLFLGTKEIIHTNFKANEKVKLAFIFNKSDSTVDGGLVYIVNNGILERAASYDNAASYIDPTGNIKIGGSKSGIRVYTIRCYPQAITYEDAFNNFVYDSDNKATLMNRNSIVTGGEIAYSECVNKIDTILIEGDLSKILNRSTNKKDSESTVNISRHCISDSTKDFSVQNGKIRKHGQSTLNYPITSMKIWLNKAKEDNVNPVLTLSPIQDAMGLNKNRYVMKNGAIPANKFVLQANYADSSGVHNGGLERLILDTWYNAKIDGEYKLRTAPLLFASNEIVHHNNEDLHETGWVEGYGTDVANGKLWKDVATKDFPYIIRNAPDSFPCAVFYRDTTTDDDTIHFLGQYVFMDDKKSDFLYGERSIYHYYDETDPFCLKKENNKMDKKENRVWNNDNVLRIEVVLLNNALTSYMSFLVPKGASVNADGNVVGGNGTVDCDLIKTDSRGNPLNFYWEDYFEMIYPDPDDVEEEVGMTKFSEGSKFRKKALPFVDLLRWLTSTYNNLAKFEAEAAQHFDLYKLAAYYIFLLRFGLVDSVERNAQLKTYDGIHWCYEPWDMDIALGNKNDGGLAYDPPVNRDTRLPGDQTIWAMSGRSTTTSNWLWDALEAWDYWMDNIVPAVAQALYSAGLTYDNVSNMFDEEYAEKWSEVMYNESGHYKYIEMRAGDNGWLRWLLGARTSHRHWWLSTSMNYYDAMWTAGDFNNHRIYIAADKALESIDGSSLVKITPTSSTFFRLTLGDGGTVIPDINGNTSAPANRDNPAVFDVSKYAFSVKDPTHIYGATFVEELDLSCFAQKLSSLTLGGAYDAVLGAPIKTLNIGVPFTEKVSDLEYKGYVAGTSLNLSAGTNEGNDALANLKVLDITGQQSITSTADLLYSNNRRNVTDIYAIGTGIANFSSSASGNKFNELRLPARTYKTDDNDNTIVSNSLVSFVMYDSSWSTLSFWDTYTSDKREEIITEDEEGNEIVIVTANSATFKRTDIPSSINVVQFYGSTASNKCAADFVMSWISSIESDLKASLGNSYTTNALYEELQKKTLDAENIRWGTENTPVLIYYEDLAKIAQFNHANNQNAHISGYIKIADKTDLTATLLSLIREWFGETVFDKSAMNGGLVIDQDRQYVQISVGKSSYIKDGSICLDEGSSATLNATKFILSEDTTKYIWTVSADGITSESSVKGVTLIETSTGIKLIVAAESAYGDYDVVITASYVDRSSGKTLSNSATITIVGVTYPDDFAVKTRSILGGDARRFMIDSTIASNMNIFNPVDRGNIAYDNDVLRLNYILYNKQQQVEFYVEPTSIGYSATLKDILYTISSVGPLSYKDLTGGSSDLLPVGMSEYLYYNKAATKNGIVLATDSILPSDMVLYELNITIRIGGKYIRKNVNIILLDDAEIILNSSENPSLFVMLGNKYEALYGIGVGTALYKSTLFSISGELDLSANDQLGALKSNKNDSILLYLYNVTSLILDGCSAIQRTNSTISGEDKNQFRFDNMTNLTSISMNGCSSMDGTLDLSSCRKLTYFDGTGTSLGVKLPTGSIIETLKLGNPVSIYLTNPTSLAVANVEALGSLNLLSIELINVSLSSLCGFSIFNKIYNP